MVVVVVVLGVSSEQDRQNQASSLDLAAMSVRVDNSGIPFSTQARNLGLTISSNATMDKHVSQTFAGLHKLC